MPTLDSYNEDKPLKCLLIGASGAGKTGALGSLVDAGYKLRILDYDNGLDVLPQVITKRENLKNVSYVTLTDGLQLVGDKIITKGMPSAFQKGLKLLNDWKPEGEESLGKATDWGRDTIIVVDSLTFMGQAALARVLFMNGRGGGKPEIQDWGDAMAQLEHVLGMLYSDAINCHVIVLTHIAFVGGDEGAPLFGFPSALGSKLPPKVGRYFNHTLQADVIGSGKAAKRVIRTKPNGLIDIKCPLKDIPETLPLATGLAEYFKLARGV